LGSSHAEPAGGELLGFAGEQQTGEVEKFGEVGVS